MAGSDTPRRRTTVGGSRRAPRPALNRPPRNAASKPPSRPAPVPRPAPIQTAEDAPPESASTACPWLYLLADPDRRASAVTADHRCELRPDEVPGPGHQLAYCLGENHLACPQLRSYEHDRWAAAAAARERDVSVVASEPAAHAAPATELRPHPFAAPPRRHGHPSLAGRLPWIAAGAAAALSLIAGFALVANPDRSAADEVPTEPAAVTAAVVQPPATATPEPAPAATPRPTVYTVQPGDTLSSIARDLDVSVADLIEVNDLANGQGVRIGDQLKVPAPLAGPPPDRSPDRPTAATD